MNLYDEFFLIIRELRERRVSYSVIGGIAMAFHAEPRFTRDIDLLVHPDAMGDVKDALAKCGYFESSAPWTFKNTRMTLRRFMKTEGEDNLVVDVLASGEKRYKEILKNSIEQESTDGPVRIADKEDMVWMKQQRGSDQDRVDIERLRDDKDRENDKGAE
jgi:hypothetical protein